jgi:hypothetical protein
VRTEHSDETTLTPQYIIDRYVETFARIYGYRPRAHYIGSGLYYINGETTNRVMLFRELERLQALAQPSNPSPRTNMVQRLIAKLRAL